jgi:hypothetical protein
MRRLGTIVAMDDITWPSIHPRFREEVAARQTVAPPALRPRDFSTFDDFGVVHIVKDVLSTSSDDVSSQVT